MFERVSKLERSTDAGKTWSQLDSGALTEALYPDKSRAGELSGSMGLQMTDGSSVRFVGPVPDLSTLRLCPCP